MVGGFPVPPISDQKRERHRLVDQRYRKVHPGRWKAYKLAYDAAHREELRAARKAYYAAHKEDGAKYNRLYKETHPEYTRLYYETHKEAERLRARAYALANPEAKRNRDARRRARKLSVPSTLTTPQWKAIVAVYKGRCAYCGAKPKKLTQDHVTPLSRGGHHTAENVVPSCWPCNSRKHTGPPPLIPSLRLLL